MKLSERLKKHEDGAEPAYSLTSAPKPTVSSPAERLPADPLAVLKHRAQTALYAKLGSRLYDSSLTDEQLHSFVVEELGNVMEGEGAPLSSAERQQLVGEIRDDILGYGPIEKFLADPTVTEIMVNAEEAIFIEREGRLYETDARFVSRSHLRRVIERIVSQVGRRMRRSRSHRA